MRPSDYIVKLVETIRTSTVSSLETDLLQLPATPMNTTDLLSDNTRYRIAKECLIELARTKHDATLSHHIYKVVAAYFDNAAETLLAPYEDDLNVTTAEDDEAKKCVEAQAMQQREMAALTWYHFLNDTLSGHIEGEGLLQLGQAYVSEPYKYIALIAWALNKEISLDIIEHSDIVKRFFQYHLIQMVQLANTYKILGKLTARGNFFFSYYQKISCEERGLVNFHLNGKKYSYNLLGEKFEIVTQLSRSNTPLMRRESTERIDFNESPALPDFFEKKITLLYALFEFELIKFILNTNDDTLLRALIRKILTSELAENVLIETVGAIACGKLTQRETNVILRETLACYYSPATPINKKFESLVKKVPFLIYKIPDMRLLPINLVESTTEKLLQDPALKSHYHLPWLIQHFEKLNKIIFFTVRETILDYILDIILTPSYIDAQTVTSPIDNDNFKNILFQLERKFLEKLSYFTRNLEKAFEKFYISEDYYELKSSWHIQLKTINFIFLLNTKLKIENTYPLTFYEFTTVLMENYLNKGKGFFCKLFDLISESDEVTTQLLKEAFILSKDDALLMYIIRYVYGAFNEEEKIHFFHHPFGKDHVIYDIILKNAPLFENKIALQLIPLNEITLQLALIRSLSTKTRAYKILLKSSSLTTDIVNSFFSCFFQMYELNSTQNYRYLEEHLSLISPQMLTKNMLTDIVKKMLESTYFDDRFILFLFTFVQHNIFPTEQLSAIGIALLKKNKVSLFMRICGFSDNQLFSSCITKHNFDLLSKTLVAYRGIDFAYEKENLHAISRYEDDNRNNLFHLAATAGNAEHLKDLVVFFETNDNVLRRLLFAENINNEMPLATNEGSNTEEINGILESSRNRLIIPPRTLHFWPDRSNKRERPDPILFSDSDSDPEIESPLLKDPRIERMPKGMDDDSSADAESSDSDDSIQRLLNM